MINTHTITGTLRTHTCRFRPNDLTPLELAKRHGATHLYPILSPVIRNAIPTSTLEKLQTHFHGLIHLLIPTISQQLIQLPLLETLTELDGEAMWFAIAGGERKGFLYQLDERELMVEAVGVDVGNASGRWRILSEGPREVHQLLFVQDSVLNE